MICSLKSSLTRLNHFRFGIYNYPVLIILITAKTKSSESTEPLRAIKQAPREVSTVRTPCSQLPLPEPVTKARPRYTRRWSLATAGWVVSVLVHIAIVVAFLVAAPSFAPSSTVRQTPKATIENPVELSPAKPLLMETKPLATNLDTPAAMPEAVRLLPQVPQVPQGQASISTSPVITAWGPTPAGGQGPAAGPEVTVGSSYAGSFCGVAGSADRVCFVVDCSGSMIMAFDYVRQELKRAIAKLGPGQYFQVIFFAGGSPVEMTPGVLTRANAPKRDKALDFVEKAKLVDVPNGDAAWQAVADALAMAFNAKTFDGQPAKLIYLFTDGQFDHDKISQTLQKLQGQSSELVTVNVIACGVGLNKDFLRALAHQYRGEFRFISDEELAGAGF